MRRLIFVMFLVVPFATVSVVAKELHWDALSVIARLDGGGQLHVDERQDMVFSGDWNGGERIFRIAPGQKLDLQGISRIDPATGASTELTEGSLGEVDHYAWSNSTTLRWRSRRPSDPEFANTSIVYVLHYTLSNILQKEDDHYVLNHDFAFAERAGVIRQFSLRLTVDPQWQPIGAVKTDYSAGPLAPGSSFVVKVLLRYTGNESALTVNSGAPLSLKVEIGAILGVPLILFVVVMRRERSLGRLTPLSAGQIDRPWIIEHVFSLPAEVVGATWDRKISSDEVSATLARMVVEGKLASTVKKKKIGKDSLELDLLVPRATLKGYERALIEGLFFKGDHTSTEAVRKHYAKSGFDPVAKISPQLQKIVDKQSPPGKSSGAAGGISFAIFFVLVADLVRVAVTMSDLRVAAGVLFCITLFLTVFAAGAPSRWKNHLDYGMGQALLCLMPAGLVLTVGLILLRAATLYGRMGMDDQILTGIAIALLWVACCSVTALASEDGPEALAWRQKLTAARMWIRRELEKERPDLEDRWFPYVLAFGLENRMRKWYRPFGVSSHGSGVNDGSGSFRSSGSSGSGSSWSGGGGAFGGAGASGAWSAAAAGMAAGVAAPGSASDGGGGGGGSSGGGGGGGW
ncbi:MAG: hypothetical protein ABI718_06425 [Acidobacteriota bacterium]